ncbi:hypothetical protein Golomagni_06350, partial [Golovinomyces magnicellulatus]
MLTIKALTVFTTLACVSAQVTFTGTTVSLNGVDYFIDPHVAGKLPRGKCNVANDSSSDWGLQPAVVIAEKTGLQSISSTLTNWTKTDDVFQKAFAECIFGATPGATLAFDKAVLVHSLEGAKLASGPYFVNSKTGNAHRVFRLYDDYAQSFTQSVIQQEDGSFEQLRGRVGTLDTPTVAVPSRLYYTKTKERPLAGVRVGVKDLYQLKGVKTSNGNRAWYHLYDAANETSAAVQKLMDAGAVVLGLQALSQFANGDTVNADFVDIPMPFNPRGDGYQIAHGSSNGGATSMASYEWLDLALGSDTGGSIRLPALSSGVFGNRPTHGIGSLDNVTPLSPAMDTPGLFARDLKLWDIAQEVLYQGYDRYGGKTPKIIYTLDLPNGTDQMATIVREFVAKTANATGAKVVALNMTKLWEDTRPKAANGTSYVDLLSKTYATLITKDQVRLVGDKFFKDYAAKHDGRKPYLNPSVDIRWKYAAKNVSDADLQQAHFNMTLFGDWFNTHVAKKNNATCSDSLVRYHDQFTTPIRRDTYTPGATVPIGFTLGRYSIFSGAPESAFPVGETLDVSDITGHKEKFPVGMAVLAARGCDGVLVNLAKDLVKAGVIAEPKS